MDAKNTYKHRPVVHWAVLFLFIFGGIGLGGWQAMVHPDTPLPPAWSPTKPLVVSDPVTHLTSWKLNRALGVERACLAALATGASAQSKPDFIESPQCGIAPQVTLNAAADATMSPFNTRCQTALRLTMWTQHGLQPAAREVFGQDVAWILHFSSYSCRAMRTTSGTNGRMSTHSTADAIDISGFMLGDGTTISLVHDWEGDVDKVRFLRRANASACKWFRVTLGPDYNALHADHFHLQHTGFGLCR